MKVKREVTKSLLCQGEEKGRMRTVQPLVLASKSFTLVEFNCFVSKEWTRLIPLKRK